MNQELDFKKLTVLAYLAACARNNGHARLFEIAHIYALQNKRILLLTGRSQFVFTYRSALAQVCLFSNKSACTIKRMF